MTGDRDPNLHYCDFEGCDWASADYEAVTFHKITHQVGPLLDMLQGVTRADTDARDRKELARWIVEMKLRHGVEPAAILSDYGEAMRLVMESGAV